MTGLAKAARLSFIMVVLAVKVSPTLGTAFEERTLHEVSLSSVDMLTSSTSGLVVTSSFPEPKRMKHKQTFFKARKKSGKGHQTRKGMKQKRTKMSQRSSKAWFGKGGKGGNKHSRSMSDSHDELDARITIMSSSAFVAAGSYYHSDDFSESSDEEEHAVETSENSYDDSSVNDAESNDSSSGHHFTDDDENSHDHSVDGRGATSDHSDLEDMNTDGNSDDSDGDGGGDSDGGGDDDSEESEDSEDSESDSIEEEVFRYREPTDPPHLSESEGSQDVDNQGAELTTSTYDRQQSFRLIEMPNFRLIYIFPPDAGLPTTDDYEIAADLTADHLAQYIAVVYRESIAYFVSEEVAKSYSQTAARIEFKPSSYVDRRAAVNSPTEEELMHNVEAAFTGAHLSSFILILHQLSPNNVFSQTQGIKFVPFSEFEPVQNSNERARRGMIIGISGAIAAAAMIFLSLALLLYRRQAEKDEKQSFSSIDTPQGCDTYKPIENPAEKISNHKVRDPNNIAGNNVESQSHPTNCSGGLGRKPILKITRKSFRRNRVTEDNSKNPYLLSETEQEVESERAEQISDSVHDSMSESIYTSGSDVCSTSSTITSAVASNMVKV